MLLCASAPCAHNSISSKYFNHRIVHFLKLQNSTLSVHSLNAGRVGNDVVDAKDTQSESLELLEWPLLCQQVGAFCLTPMGIESAKNIPLGNNQHESQVLQEQTFDAIKLQKMLDFEDVKDIEQIVEKALSEEICRIRELCYVKITLQCAKRLHKQLFHVTNSELSPLQRIMEGIDLCEGLERDIEICLDSHFETVRDRASPELASIRKRRKDNMTALELLLRETARKIAEAGGSDSKTVTKRRARLCITVRASHKFLLPSGVVLDYSNTGATLFMEPESAIELNNSDIRLAEAENREVVAVLKRLTDKVSMVAFDILCVSKAIQILDLACARAKHAIWLGGVRPHFTNQSKEIFIERIRHPLLFGRSSSKSSTEKSIPVAVDIKVKCGTKVVVISGPNTGGKTVSLKTLGLAALMAKAGMYLPASGKPRLPWFDHIFADVGDSQSLEENLSTFSGHIQRLRRILAASGMQSLVLIDEIGGGTDPSEGSSLAAALLKYLANNVLLSVVTTHSAHLKTLNKEDERFENASVEFDLKTLRPTYRILWGISGQSNALDIAQSLEFDSEILKRARYWLGKLTPSRLKARQSDLMVQLRHQALEEQDHADSAAVHLIDIRKLHQELSAEASNLEKRKSSLLRKQITQMKKEILIAKTKMDSIVTKFKNETDKTKALPLLRVAQDAITAVVAEYSTPVTNTRFINDQLPGVGEKVIVRRLGKKEATVLKAADNTGHIVVELGTLKMRVKTSELMPTSRSAEQEKRKLGVSQVSKFWDSIASESTEVIFDAAIQTSENTVELRGMTIDDAVRTLNSAIAIRPAGSVIFIIHGIGTGVLKRAVVALLNKHPNVAKFESESIVNGGCTVAYIV